MKTIRLGTRGSALALWQANFVKSSLENIGISTELVIISSHGDRDHSGPIARLGAQGVFTREIQKELLEEKIDLAVHSMKDLPTETPEELLLAAVPLRGDTRDVLVSSKFHALAEIRSGARIGTGSLRRKNQLIHLFQILAEQEPNRTEFWHDIEITDIRGNVDTRIRKLENGEFDAILLAAAGLQRLGFADRIAGYLTPPDFLPAVGQGALALETRKNDAETIELVRKIDDRKSRLGVIAERAMLQRLEGGCIAPIGAFSQWSEEENSLTLSGRILSLDGKKRFDAQANVRLSDDQSPSDDLSAVQINSGQQEEEKVRQLGIEVAEKLLEQGASKIIAELNEKRMTL